MLRIKLLKLARILLPDSYSSLQEFVRRQTVRRVRRRLRGCDRNEKLNAAFMTSLNLIAGRYS
jgi:hypothetical protein